MLVVVAFLGLWSAAIADEPSGAAPNEPKEAALDAAPAAKPDIANADAAAPEADYADEVSDRFVAALEKQKLPYVTPVELAALRAELQQYLKRRVKTPLVGKSREALLEAIDRFVEARISGPDSYRHLRGDFDALRWQLWVAADRPQLTADESKERDRQRKWMFDYIRGLPITANERDFPERQHEGRVRVLKRDVFGSPLSPAFHYPMSPEEFELFKKRTESSGGLVSSTGTLFHEGVTVQSQSLRKRWPPGFDRPQNGPLLGNYMPDLFYCYLVETGADLANWIVAAKDGEPEYFDVATRRAGKKGDIWFDATARQLLPAQGAKMSTIEETEWYAIDRVPMKELRKRVREAPVESMVIPMFSDPRLPEGVRVIATLPTIVLENTEGTIVVGRVVPSGDEKTLVLEFCYRPLPPNPPFHPADEGYDEPYSLEPTPIETAEEAASRADPDADFIDVVSDQFASALERQNLHYVTPEALSALRAELHHYLKLRVKTPPVGPSRTELLVAMNRFVQKKFFGKGSYLVFRNQFDMLKWQLWTAIDRRELTVEETAERDRQREWMRDYIRSLPEPDLGRTYPGYSHRTQLERLEQEVFGNPLSPFFHDPMSAEEFEQFTRQVEASKTQGGAPARHALLLSQNDIFRTGVRVRVESLQKRWPPGFPIGGLTIVDTQDFSFCPVPNDIVEPSEYQKNGLSFANATRRLVPKRGAKMTTLKETDWSVLDRMSIEELRQRVSEDPVDSLEIPKFSQPQSTEALRAYRQLPTVVLESAEGKILLVRLLEHTGGSTAHLQIHRRPQPAYLPFHPADEGYERPDQPPFTLIELVDALSDRFIRTLKRQDLPFVGPEEIEALRAELHDYLELRVTAPMPMQMQMLIDKRGREALLKDVNYFVQRKFPGPECYLSFRKQFDALKWQLWLATARRGYLAEDKKKVLLSQRAWTCDTIRGLPREANGSTRQPPPSEMQIKRLEGELFDNPLGPFLNDPMSAEEFEAFQKRVERITDFTSAQSDIVSAAASLRAATLEKQRPTALPVDEIETRGTDGDGGFRWRSERLPEGRRLFFDAGSQQSIEQPAGLDEKGTEAWLLESKKGDLWFDAKTRRLTAVRGARLATLPETDWYAVDRIPLAALRTRLAESPQESYTLAELPDGKPDRLAVEKVVQELPTLVLETAEGKVVLLRVERYDGNSALVLWRARPLAPYPPFHAGDGEAEAPQADPRKQTGAAPKEEGAATSPAAVAR
jgi:hypothetical protein